MQADTRIIMPPLLDGGGGGAAAEIVQTTLEHFGEPMIAGRTISEILSMKGWKRHQWYKMILPEEKEEAMKTVETARRAKISISKMGERNPMKRPEVRAKHKEAVTRPEHKARMCGDNNPAKRSEVRAKISKNNPMNRPEARAKVSASKMGENHPNWQGGKSFEPYCSAFNIQLKESVRNRDNRTCVLCGKSEIQNGQRLCVHHIDADKTQGCNGKRWYLCALCRSCNTRPDTVEKEFLIVTGGRSVQ